MATNESLALSLQDARSQLESTLQQVLHTYEQRIHRELDLRLDLTRPLDPDPDADAAERELYSTLRLLVDQFHQNPAVSQSGLKIRGLTAMDSDADGKVALNVSYEYPV